LSHPPLLFFTHFYAALSLPRFLSFRTGKEDSPIAMWTEKERTSICNKGLCGTRQPVSISFTKRTTSLSQTQLCHGIWHYASLCMLVVAVDSRHSYARSISHSLTSMLTQTLAPTRTPTSFSGSASDAHSELVLYCLTLTLKICDIHINNHFLQLLYSTPHSPLTPGREQKPSHFKRNAVEHTSQ
jgi:hypothetical protein